MRHVSAAQLRLELTPIKPALERRRSTMPLTVRLTLGEAARIMREAVKDKSYRATPVGLEVAHFIRWFRNEYGATSETLRDYEAILAKLAIDHADLALTDFEPPAGTPAPARVHRRALGRGRTADAQEGARRADVVLQMGSSRVQAPRQPRRADP